MAQLYESDQGDFVSCCGKSGLKWNYSLLIFVGWGRIKQKKSRALIYGENGNFVAIQETKLGTVDTMFCHKILRFIDK